MNFINATFLKPGVLFLMDSRFCLFLKTTYVFKNKNGFRFKCLEMDGSGIQEYYMMKTEPITIFTAKEEKGSF